MSRVPKLDMYGIDDAGVYHPPSREAYERFVSPALDAARLHCAVCRLPLGEGAPHCLACDGKIESEAITGLELERTRAAKAAEHVDLLCTALKEACTIMACRYDETRAAEDIANVLSGLPSWLRPEGWGS